MTKPIKETFAEHECIIWEIEHESIGIYSTSNSLFTITSTITEFRFLEASARL